MEKSEESPTPAQKGPRRGKGFVIAIFGTGLLAGMIVAGLNIAGAQTGDSNPESDSAPAPGREGVRIKGKHGPRGMHFGFGGPGVIHGEFVVAKKDGGFQTMLSQKGKVTEVSSSSITVKSEDDFSKTYAVNDDTLVNAGNNGIDDVKKDDDVHITAIVDGRTARAVDIMDRSRIQELRGKWMPGPKRTPGEAKPSAAA